MFKMALITLAHSNGFMYQAPTTKLEINSSKTYALLSATVEKILKKEEGKSELSEKRN